MNGRTLKSHLFGIAFDPAGLIHRRALYSTAPVFNGNRRGRQAIIVLLPGFIRRLLQAGSRPGSQALPGSNLAGSGCVRQAAAVSDFPGRRGAMARQLASAHHPAFPAPGGVTWIGPTNGSQH